MRSSLVSRWFALVFLGCFPNAGVSVASQDPVEIITPIGPDAWDVKAGDWFVNGRAVTWNGGSNGGLILLKDTMLKNCVIKAQVNFLSEFSSAAIVGRVNGDDFYQFEWYTRGNEVFERQLGLMYGPSGLWERIVPAILREPQIQTWYSLKMSIRGNRIRCFVDNQLYFDVKDTKYAVPGRVGLRVWLPAQVKFRNFTVISYDQPDRK